MKVTYGYNSAPKTLNATTAETISWGASEIAGSQTAVYTLELTGTANDVGSLTRFRCKASGQTIWDTDMGHLQALIQRLSRSNHDAANADQTLSFPLMALDAKGDERYTVGFPNGSSPTVEITKDNTGGAGGALLGWRLADTVYQWYSMFLCSQMNIGVSVVNGRMPITQPGFLRGFSVPTTGLTRVRLVVNGDEIVSQTGAMLIEAQQMEGGDSFTTPIFIKLDEMVEIVAGSSFLEVSTDGTWGGTTNELGIYSYVAQTVEA